MTAKIIDGKNISLEIQKNITSKILDIRKEYAVSPKLVVILVGNNPASEIYVKNKEKAAYEVGIDSVTIRLPEVIEQDELIDKIKELNSDDSIHAILLQLPLPKHINAAEVIDNIDYHKDVDGLHPINIGKTVINRLVGDDSAVVPCTPQGCLHLIRNVLNGKLEGKKALVIGRSILVGKPTAILLLHQGCTTTIAHSKTKDLKAECLQADILVSAVGIPKIITADMVKNGAVVIDVGISRITTKEGNIELSGDVDFENVKEVASAITPVPGGVGPMTIAYLLKNTVDLCLRQIRK